MPENKLQHYVPKCHLRPFCLDPGRSAVNLYNIARDRLIEGAPIKGQCARNDFYGKDGFLERALQQPERDYAVAVVKGADDPGSVTRADLAILRDFALLQTFRTHGYVEKLIAISDRHYADMEAAAPGKPLPPRMLSNVDEAVVMAMRQFVSCRKHVTDLETCLIVNGTQREFITSDDPAIHTNRFHFQKLGKNTFGLGSAGAIFFLPLTPKLAFMAFDGNVYLVPGREGDIVVIRSADEVSALNELQLLHARQNLYYADRATGVRLSAEFKRCAERRPTAWHELTYFERVGETDELEYFKPIEAMTLEPGRQFLTGLHQVYVRPSRWTGLLSYRLRPRFVNTGTAAGWVRPSSTTMREMMERRTAGTKPVIMSETK